MWREYAERMEAKIKTQKYHRASKNPQPLPPTPPKKTPGGEIDPE